MNAHVTPKIGYYLVCTVGQDAIRRHQVSKEKLCTCGGEAARPCAHIEAVADYLQQGGCRAAQVPTCPICDAPVELKDPSFWRCSRESSHYWQWRGERNGGAIRELFTHPHPAKLGAFYEQTIDGREAFLAQRIQMGLGEKEAIWMYISLDINQRACMFLVLLAKLVLGIWELIVWLCRDWLNT